MSAPAPGSRTAALITGASSGIGRALAREFAAHGHDVVVVARDSAALDALASELSDAHGVGATALAADLSWSGSGKALFEQLAERDLAVGTLVNNAGFGIHGPFIETALEREHELVRLQIDSVLELTKLALPPMIARGVGQILNVASVYAFSPVPNQAVYSAGKAFMLHFSEALASELAATGVGISVLCPGITSTEFRKRAGMKEKKSRWAMTPEEVAAIAYRDLQRGKRIIVPGAANRLFVRMARLVPGGSATSLVRGINRARGIDKPGTGT